MILFFKTQDIGIRCGDNIAFLTGETLLQAPRPAVYGSARGLFFLGFVGSFRC
jgi:hypothetical protein